MTHGLGPRLHAVASAVKPGRPVVDVGTDHARVPVHLVASGTCPRAVAGDRLEGPLRAAHRTVAEAGLEDRIALRRGDGLSVARPEDAGTVVIAGMGGATICAILDRAGPRRLAIERLVVQPNTEWTTVRLHLHELGFGLVDETLVEQDGKFYPVLGGAPDVPVGPAPTGADLAFGPLIRRRGGPTYARFLAHRRARLRAALRGARRGRDPTAARTLAADLAMVLAELDRFDASM